MKNKCANANEPSYNMIWGKCKRWEQSQISLSKFYKKCSHLWEYKVNEETILYEHSNESIEINTLNNNDDMRNHLLSYEVLILEVSIHNVRVECNRTLYWALID